MTGPGLNKNYFIWIILTAAFLLRITGVAGGLPASYNSTEYFLAKTALSMGARQSIDPLIYIYPTLYAYFLLAQYILIYLGGHLAGVFATSVDFAVRFLTDPSVFYLTGRCTNVILSVFTVLLFYMFMRKMFGEVSARFAALTATLSFHLIQFSRYAVPDTLLILFSTLATFWMLQTYYQPSRKNFFLSGLFTGLAIGSKYNAGFLMLGLLLVPILHRLTDRTFKYWSRTLLAVFSVLAGFLILNPLWIVRFSEFFTGYQLMAAQMRTAVSYDYGINYIWEISEMIRYETLIGAGFLLATGYALVRRSKTDLILLVPLLITFIYVGSWQKKGLDYLFAVFPAWIILLSLALETLWNKLRTGRNIKILLGSALFLPSLVTDIHLDVRALHEDTRELASAWVINHVAKGEKMCYDHYTFDLGLFDVHRYTEYGAAAEQLPGAVKERVLAFAADERNVSNVPVQVKIDTGSRDDDNPYLYEAGRYRRKSLQELQREGVSYLITNSWFYQPYLSCDIDKYTPIIQEKIQAVRRFYSELDGQGRVVKLFEPDFWTPGPLIKIYKISDNADR